MCLVFVNHNRHPRYRLVVAANRDEFYDRPTAPARFWDDAPHLLAGRDLQSGGTWMGITRAGRFAALTNFRDPSGTRPDAPSRGNLVSGFLSSTENPASWLERIRPETRACNGFNLLVGDASGLWYHENQTGAVRRLDTGIYGLCNRFLDTPWPKLTHGKAAFGHLCAANPIDPEGLFEMLSDTRRAPDHDLPDTGVGLNWERRLSPRLITGAIYGTRSSTVLLMDRAGEVLFMERTWVPGQPRPVEAFTRLFRFSLESRPSGEAPPSHPGR